MVQSVGQYRVGVTFNPSQNPKVDAIKNAAALLIDLIDQYGQDRGLFDDLERDAEVGRLMRIAMEHAEAAAMWAVKAVTKGPQE